MLRLFVLKSLLYYRFIIPDVGVDLLEFTLMIILLTLKRSFYYCCIIENRVNLLELPTLHMSILLMYLVIILFHWSNVQDT